MNRYSTEIMAIDPRDGELKRWEGPPATGVSIATAQEWCDQNGLGYCKVVARVVAEVSVEEFPNIIDYDNAN